MELTILLAGAGLVLVALSLSLTIERLVRRLGVRPAADSERSRGLFDVVARIRRHLRND
jgi:hypothetical protein